MVEVLVLKVDENGVLRDKGRARNSAEQLIYAYGDAIPDATAVIVTTGTERHSALRDYNRPETPFLERSSSTLLVGCSLLDQAGTTRISNNIMNAFLNEFLSDVAATQENMLESMMEQMLESQQNAMVESYKKLGTVYTTGSAMDWSLRSDRVRDGSVAKYMHMNTISNKEKGLSIQQLLYLERKERWQLSYETRMMMSDASRNQTSTDDTTKVSIDTTHGKT
ncbi:hypothetical protein F2Q68_00039488 [Brassica cretica]|uniref:Uncharacterized protein n=1 Tax=Brassica cretica TaxID=69181 RepID=A0A8S9MEX1_BRACR|nr:hypothetical protein F2Q68_00039488 [Brassica cretica]